MAPASQYHTLVALVEDKPGVLTRIASMFRRRGFNIASLAVGKSEAPGLSRMTFVVEGDEDTVTQVIKQLDKLIDVMNVTDISNQEIVTRELALIKVRADTATRGEVIQIVHLFRANIVDVGAKSVMIEITGEDFCHGIGTYSRMHFVFNGRFNGFVMFWKGSLHEVSSEEFGYTLPQHNK